MIQVESLRDQAEQLMQDVFARHAAIRAFHLDGPIDQSVYRRHIIEAINRIHLNNKVDSYCLHFIVDRQTNAVSKKLAGYLAEEISHDELLLKDVAYLGLDQKAVEQTDVFFATKLLMGYIRFGIDRDGALPCLLWNWFVEWYSDTYNPGITERASVAFGVESTKGMVQHLEIDEALDHAVFLDEQINDYLIQDAEKVQRYLREYVELVEAYFRELLA